MPRGSRALSVLAFVLATFHAAPSQAQAAWRLSLPPDTVLHFQPKTLQDAAHPPLPPRDSEEPSALRAAPAPLAVSAIGTTDWMEWSGSPRERHELIRDVRRQRWILVGGAAQLDPQGSVWVDDPEQHGWMELTARPDRGQRDFVSAALDSSHDRLLVLTRDPLDSALAVDAFSFSSLTWMRLWTENSPGFGACAGLAVDTRRDEAVVIAMMDPASSKRFNVRIPLASSGPATVAPLTGIAVPIAYHGSVVYVPAHDCFHALFLKSTGLVSEIPSVAVAITAGPSPVASAGPGVNDYPNGMPTRLCYDAATDRLFRVDAVGELLSVSLTTGQILRYERSGLDNWRVGCALALDPVARRVWLYGGQNNFSSPLMSFSVPADSGVAWTIGTPGPPMSWREESPHGLGSRMWHSSIVDPRTSRLIVFDGQRVTTPSGLVTAHAIGQRGDWSSLGMNSPSQPRRRFMQATTYDPDHHAMLLVSGQATDGTGDLLRDVWSLSLEPNGGWTKLTPDGAFPGALRNASVAFDAPRHRFLVLGGDDLAHTTNALWELRLDPVPSWRPLVAVGEPLPAYCFMATDPLRGDGWLLARATSGYSIRHLVITPDTVYCANVIDGTTFGPLGSAGNPTTLSFDAEHRRLLGIWTRANLSAKGVMSQIVVTQLGDTAQWSSIPVPGTPPFGRTLCASSYDAASDQLIVTGGYDDFELYLGDAWQLAFLEPTPVAASLLDARADDAGAHLRWYVAANGASGVVERSDDGADWRTLGSASADGEDALRFDDATLAAGARAAYRLRVSSGGGATVTAAAWVTRDATVSAMSLRAVDSGAALAVRYALPSSAAATLRCFDVSGRLRASVRLEQRAGTYAFANALEPGVYLAELRQGTARVTTRLVRLR